MPRASSIRNGVEEAFSFWITQHDITTQHCMVEGVAQAFRKWLDENREEVVEAIAREHARSAKAV